MTVVRLCGVYIRLMVKGGGVAEPIGSTVLPIGSATPPPLTISRIYTPHNLTTVILRSPAQDDGTDSRFRNVGNYNFDAGELHKKKLLTILNFTQKIRSSQNPHWQNNLR